MTASTVPLVAMRDIALSFGGVRAVERASIELYAGEVLALVGHNGAGKSTLIKILSGAVQRDGGTIAVRGAAATIANPRDAKNYGIETIYQTLALAKAREVMGRLNPHFRRFKDPVRALSGGERQSVAIARAILFDAQILIMDEPTAALGPQETAQVGELVRKLKVEGIGIVLISHDIADVFDLADRICVMKNGRVVGTARAGDVTKDDVLGMIILGNCPPGASAGPGAMHQTPIKGPKAR
jgi:D-xylose transport system ATP-binding protein